MKKALLFLCSVILLGLGGFLIFEVLIPFLTPSDAQLSVTTTTVGELFLDGKDLGKTPFYEKNLKVGDHELELKISGKYVWKEGLTLTSHTLTVVEVNPSPNSLFTASDILNFKAGESGLVLISQPSGASVSVDEKSFGTSPLNKGLSSGVHTLKLDHEGYLSRLITINIEPGFTLYAKVFLAANPFAKLNKIDSTPKLNLFAIENHIVDLSASYSAWAAAVESGQASLGDTETKFDYLIDPNGQTYVLDQKNWDDKIRTKAAANIGYLAKNGQENLTTQAQAEWGKVKNSFN